VGSVVQIYSGPPVLAAVRSNEHICGELAQLGERLVCNQEVTGSRPVFSTSHGRMAPFGCALAWKDSAAAVAVGADCREASGRSLTTEYPANGSFFRSTNTAVFVNEGRLEGAIDAGRSSGLQASVAVPMVKLLRAYGECLGAGSR
jgi:hypothetical protein